MTQTQAIDYLGVPDPAVTTSEYQYQEGTGTDLKVSEGSFCRVIDWNTEHAPLRAMLVSEFMGKGRSDDYAADMADETIMKVLTRNASGRAFNSNNPGHMAGWNLGGYVRKVGQHMNQDGVRRETFVAREELYSDGSSHKVRQSRIRPMISPLSDGAEINILEKYVDRAATQAFGRLEANEDSEILASMVRDMIGPEQAGDDDRTDTQRTVGQRTARILLLESVGIQQKHIIRALKLTARDGVTPMSAGSFEKTRQRANATAASILETVAPEMVAEFLARPRQKKAK